jgi:hypothetical protein
VEKKVSAAFENLYAPIAKNIESAGYRPIWKTVEFFWRPGMKQVVLFCLLLLCLSQGFAKEIAGVSIPEQIKRETDQVQLVLNGAGIRKKFFFDIYITALYLEHKTDQVSTILDSDSPVRVEMKMLYSEVERGKFIQGWNDGFEANLDQAQLKELRDRLDQFNGLFETLKKGDLVMLDYFPGKGTRVMIKGVEKGVIPGVDFFQALLKVWLGPEPVSQSLKQELLGQE